MSRASTSPGRAGEGFRELQLGGASRQSWGELRSKRGLMGPGAGWDLPRSLGGQHKVCVGNGTVGALALAMASLSGLFSSFSARLGGFSV